MRAWCSSIVGFSRRWRVARVAIRQGPVDGLSSATTPGLVTDVTGVEATTPMMHALRNDAVSWTPTDDGQVIVLDMRTSRYLSLNASAGALWTLLAGGASESDLIDALHSVYGLDAERATRDVASFLGEVRARDLLIDG